MHEGTVHLLVLVIAANSAPVLAARLLGAVGAQPIDGNGRFFDGEPILGSSKTWRGLISAILLTAAVAPLLGYSLQTGALVACLAMLGDCLSSFTKRRLKLRSSAQAPLLDQLPEALLPGIVMKATFKLDWMNVVLVALAFLVIEVVFSKIFFRLGVRKRPY